jgi:hypothetical protein
MKIYHIEMSRLMDIHVVGLAYTSVTHFQIRAAFQANKDVGTTNQPWRQGSRSTGVQTTAGGAQAI